MVQLSLRALENIKKFDPKTQFLDAKLEVSTKVGVKGFLNRAWRHISQFFGRRTIFRADAVARSVTRLIAQDTAQIQVIKESKGFKHLVSFVKSQAGVSSSSYARGMIYRKASDTLEQLNKTLTQTERVAKLDATKPDAKIKEAKPPSKVDATKPDTKLKEAKPPSKVDAIKPDAKIKEAKPPSKVDAIKPDTKLEGDLNKEFQLQIKLAAVEYKLEPKDYKRILDKFNIPAGFKKDLIHTLAFTLCRALSEDVNRLRSFKPSYRYSRVQFAYDIAIKRTNQRLPKEYRDILEDIATSINDEREVRVVTNPEFRALNPVTPQPKPRKPVHTNYRADYDYSEFDDPRDMGYNSSGRGHTEALRRAERAKQTYEVLPLEEQDDSPEALGYGHV